MNTLYYGDNLKILSDRNYFPDECVDLVYLDPPFNSNRNYNVLFKDESGAEAEAQITAFEDTWHWNQAAENAYHDLVMQADDVSKMLESFRSFIGENQMMAYLVMMAARLVELHRVLKPTGSLYLHCDPTASHYLKILLDTVFGVENFINEIVWKRSDAHNDAKQGSKHFGRIHDTIFFYSKVRNHKDFERTWNTVYKPYDENYVKANYRNIEEVTGRLYKSTDLTAAKPGGDTSYDWKGRKPPEGRYWAYSYANMQKFDAENRLYYTSSGLPRLKQYLDEMHGVSIQDFWDDIPLISAHAQERLGYPTQKPVALLERIVQASSNEGDVVLDPFCGCGTTIAAAQRLNRRWIGIDITHLSIALQKYRLKDSFQLVEKRDYKVIGEPEDLASAIELARKDNERYQFQWWALSLIKARPLGASSGGKQGKKGSDKGIDGIIPFFDDRSGKSKRVLVQVKSGKVKSGDIRDLRGTVQREEAAIGVFITLDNPSKDMVKEAVSAGFYHSEGWRRDYPKIQILTIEELLNGKEVQMPTDSTAFKQAERITKNEEQHKLF